MFASHCCGDFCKGLKSEIVNSGDKLTITITGEKEKLVVVEKKLNALKTRHCDDKGEDCCS
ncbi:MAG: hypothetical protein GWP15_00450 [Nitrospirae bacterium]|nr:hypothetical protein [Nitrospirota bacterium]